MTTETTAFMIGYGFFTLILALLIYAWRRESRLLGITKENLFRSYDKQEETFKMLNEALNEKQIISNKNAILELKDKEQDKLFESLARINQNLIDANNQLESELDRGNEIITWLKADLEKAYKLNAQNEDTIASLIALDKIDRRSVASGIGNPLENVMLTFKPAIDWTVPQAFPKDYEIPMDTNVISIEDPERVGKTTEKSTAPFLTWSNGVNSIRNGFRLAPLNPTDHPLHPEFKNKAQ
jgi:hypothetical protein